MALLAIEGGVPVRRSMLPYGRQSIDDDDVAAVVSVLRSDWLTTGPAVPAFETAFASVVGARHAVAVSNGTAALHAAVATAGIGPGDEVIVPAMTFAASANCVRYQGATVVFADVREDDLNLDPRILDRLRTPRTRAIITVDYAGQPSDLEELGAFAVQHGLRLIEDAAHAPGATYRGRSIGSLADFTTFSFHPVKHITTGEGGMVTTQDDQLAAGLRRFRNHGIDTDHRQRAATGTHTYEMVDLGYNYRLSDLQCALGLRQLGKLPASLIRRREIAARYTAAFAGLAELETPLTRDDREPAWHLYVVRVVLDRLRVDRDRVVQALRAENIGANVHFIPVPWHPYYQALGYRRGSWPVSERVYPRLISLPMFHAMSDDDADDVIRAVTRVIGRYRA